jgi:serine/threonine-protein kinase
MRDAVQPLNPFIGSIVEDRYRIEEQLGEGAMGVVYRGRHVKVGRTVAIKVLHDHLVQNPEMVDRFEREARIAARLHHKNLVAVIDLATHDTRRMMVLEFAPGASLASLVSAPMRRERVIDLTRQLLLGLEHAHTLGLIHRDLKPENVLVETSLDGRQVPRIVDFGIAVLRDPDETTLDGRRLTTTGTVLGTPMYMSPEHARGERVDARTDLFSLGVIVYEMLAGTPPFEGSAVEVMMLNIMQEPPSVATRANVDVDPLLEAFARKLMARTVEDRFASATHALETLALIDSDRDTAAQALGLAVATPRLVVDDTVITHRHPRPRTEQPALEKPVSASDVRPIEPPPRRQWGPMLGAAAVLGLAFAVVLWMGHATRERPEIVAPHVDLAPSSYDLEAPIEVRATAMLPAPPMGPSSSARVVAPEERVPMTPPLAATQRVVIASA